MKRVIYFVLIIISSCLFSQEVIVDSVYSDADLDGDMMFGLITQEYYISTISYSLITGDLGTLGIYPEPNSTVRAYISFFLPPIPEGMSLENATVRLYQSSAYGNDTSGYPIWDIPDGDTVFCIMDHIDYGFDLDQYDWTVGEPGNPNTISSNIGIISDNPDIGYKFLDVTDNVTDDYLNNRIKTQFRIRFPVNTDWDNQGDELYFISGNSIFDDRKPTLFLTYSSISSVSNNYDFFTEISLFPNPFNPYTNVSFTLYVDTDVEINIYDIKGHQIRQLINNHFTKGDYFFVWDGKDDQNNSSPSGVYFLRFLADDQFIESRKIVLVK